MKWLKPPADWVTLNSNGSSLGNFGSIGGGGIIRDSICDLLFPFSTPLCEGTNNQAELGAVLFGLAWCIQLGCNKVILELDYELSYKWIMRQTNPSWQFNQTLARIHTFIDQLQDFKCRYINRETNFVADSMAKFSHSLTIPQVFFDVQSTSRNARAYYALDKLDMFAFRRKTLKRNKEPP